MNVEQKAGISGHSKQIHGVALVSCVYVCVCIRTQLHVCLGVCVCTYIHNCTCVLGNSCYELVNVATFQVPVV